jgi:hypothetical protein
MKMEEMGGCWTLQTFMFGMYDLTRPIPLDINGRGGYTLINDGKVNL